ncbi:hypothetical protein [Hyphococcus sp.]|uniref:hypothetical protein n=1 Tax=Hyphococcus sp. TaxID=2038636 RepID=UPI003D0B1000
MSFKAKALLLFEAFEQGCIQTDLQPDKVQDYALSDGWEIQSLAQDETHDSSEWNKFIKGEGVVWLRLVSAPIRSEKRAGHACAVAALRGYVDEEKHLAVIEAREMISMLEERPYASEITWVNPGLINLKEGYEDNGGAAFLTMAPQGHENMVMSYGVIESENLISHFLGAVPRWWVEDMRESRSAE